MLLSFSIMSVGLSLRTMETVRNTLMKHKKRPGGHKEGVSSAGPVVLNEDSSVPSISRIWLMAA